ncbi:hypothetical protein GEV43_00400 [Actinomadura sp. J1-007]|uniref:hypothetical protein n=1 Tax=Actinomadura sp. J1-007 TaxID=2661913 RepID=UPI001324CF83|nr:hypothetical protein [Actinomadura sp. J1-007]MWK32681.1 hypothetical protein [Actinomadura sp. J1-007]
MRAATYAAVRGAGRADLAEALIDAVGERWGDAEAARLLPACGAEAVRSRLDRLAYAVANWASVGRAHPGPMLDHAERSLAGLREGVRDDWWRRHAPGVAAAVEHDPGRVVGLLERHWTAPTPPRPLEPRVGYLLAAEPARMLRLLLVPERRGVLCRLMARRSFRDRLLRLDAGDVAAVARAVRDDERALRLLLAAFPPAARERIFEEAMAGKDLATAEPGGDLLDVLPHARRAREAARMLRLRWVAESPWRACEVASFLPYGEALPRLRELTRRPDADERARGYALLVRCAGRARSPEVTDRLMDALGRLRNEQDPVRQAALNALVSLPGYAFGRRHVPAVERFAADALNARDCSPGTRSALERIAVRLCRDGAAAGDTGLVAAGFDLLERLAAYTAPPSMAGIDRVLRRGQEHDLVRALAGQVEASARRGDHRAALALARALGRRGHGVPELQDALEAATRSSRNEVAARAIAYWLEPPRTRAARAGAVLGREPSAVWLPSVLAAVARERTDLLSLVIAGPRGRFKPPAASPVPDVEPSWTRRWTARQRESFLDLLDELATDPGLLETARNRAVAAIATVAGAGAERLRPYLRTGDAAQRRAALTAAPWVARPQDMLADLLALAPSDDAHVAVYAASRAARFVPPSELAAVLGPVLSGGRITARKEAARILLHHRAPEAAALVTAAWDDPEQHRDVKAAIVSAVRARLAEPAAERILAEAANGPRDLARQVLGTSPLLIEERFRERYAALVLRVAGGGDPEARDAALHAVPQWAPWSPDAPAMLADLITDLGETRHWSAALASLVRCATGGTGTSELGTTATRLAAASAAPAACAAPTAPTASERDDAGAERDLPAVQRLEALVASVRDAAIADRTAAEPAIRALDGRLPEPLASELVAATLRWDPPAATAAHPGTAEVIDGLADRCAGTGVLAVLDVAAALAQGPDDPRAVWSPPRTEPDPGTVLPHAERLAARGDLSGGLFACALGGRHAERAGWPEEWRTLLRRLRAHDHPDVSYAAHRIRTAPSDPVAREASRSTFRAWAASQRRTDRTAEDGARSSV